MKKVAFAWELGGGFGHIAPFLPIATALANAGVQCVFAVRDPDRMEKLVGRQSLPRSIGHIQAPLIGKPDKLVCPHPCRLSEVLANMGYQNTESVAQAARQWRQLLVEQQPDLLIADHAPSALLAARGMGAPTALFGTGFVNPASSGSLLSDPKDGHSMHTDRVLESMNSVLRSFDAPLINEFHELFLGHRAIWLTTFRELDHQRGRIHGQYIGTWSLPEQSAPLDWPPGAKPRLLAYLKPSRGLGHLFDWLRRNSIASVIVCDGLDAKPLQRLATENLRFVQSPVPLAALCESCDVAVTNANHNTTCNLLRLGKPVMQLPLNLEQNVTAQRVCELGAGAAAAASDGQQIVWELAHLIANQAAFDAASEFAASYQSYDPQAAIDGIAEAIVNLG